MENKSTILLLNQSTWGATTWDAKGQHSKLHVLFFPTWNHKGRENRGRTSCSKGSHGTQLYSCRQPDFEVGAPRPRSSACATRAPCAIPSGHSAVPPFRRRSFSKHRGGHFTKKKRKRKKEKPTTKVGIGPGVTRSGGRPPRSLRPRCPAARLAADGADSNPGPPPSPRGVPLRLRLARESQAARRPGPLRAGAARALTAESGRSLTRAGRQRATHTQAS